MILSILALRNLEQTSSFLRKIFDDLKISDTVAEKLIERKKMRFYFWFVRYLCISSGLEQYVSIAAVYFTLLSMASALAIFGTVKVPTDCYCYCDNTVAVCFSVRRTYYIRFYFYMGYMLWYW